LSSFSHQESTSNGWPADEVRVRVAAADEFGDVAEFYVETAYAGGIRPTDQVVVALSRGQLVGAYRLAREHGLLVLRGMRVRADLRRHGIGARLLDALKDVEEACYCVPHSYLSSFYGRAGFEPAQPAETPAFLRERAERYDARGLNVVVMRREPAQSRDLTSRGAR
jgi:N-acetylglutamate synthase-like GNAT family acetyltransferase